MTPLVDKSYSKDDVEAIIVRHDAEKARDAREKAISEGFDKMSMRLDAANHAKAEVADRIAQQTVVITAVQGDVGQVKVDVAGVQDDVAALQGKVAPLLKDYTFNLHLRGLLSSWTGRAFTALVALLSVGGGQQVIGWLSHIATH